MKFTFFRLVLLPLLLTAVAWLWQAGPAWSAPPSIAVILPSTHPHLATIHSVFLKKLAEISSNQPAPRYYLQTPNDDYMSLRNSARKAVALGADLILAFGTNAALAAKAESFQTPVLFADVIEPEAIGLVTHSRRDSQLATGVRGNIPLPTLFKLLRDLTNINKLALVIDGDVSDKPMTAVFKDAAGRRGIDLVAIPAHDRSPAEIVRAIVERGADGLLIVESESRYQALVDLALEKKLPTVSTVPGMAERGALLVMETSEEEQGEALAEITRKVLDGDFPEEIPVVVPHDSEVVINLNSAQRCGLQVPFEVLSQASKVIR